MLNHTRHDPAFPEMSFGVASFSDAAGVIEPLVLAMTCTPLQVLLRNVSESCRGLKALCLFSDWKRND